MARTITKTALLAVEGKDESNFFQALLVHLGLTNVQIEDIGGKDKFRKEMDAFALTPGFEKINRFGFVRDAESLPAKSAFDSMCFVLDKINIPKPRKPGIVFEQNGLKTGIYIMPDNTVTGMLENLCLSTIVGTEYERCVNDYISCVGSLHSEPEELTFNTAKAKIQAYLAGKVPIVNSLGLSAQKGTWDFDHQSFQYLNNFLTELFF